MTEISITPYVISYSVRFYDELIPVYKMCLPYIQTAWSLRQHLKKLSLSSLNQTESEIRQAKRALRALAEATAKQINVQGDRIVSAGTLLSQNAGFDEFDTACQAFCQEAKILWQEKAQEFAEFEEEVRHKANGMIETPGYTLITSNPFAAFVYHEQVQSRVERSRSRAQEYYDEQCENYRDEIGYELNAHLQEYRKAFLEEALLAADQACYELYLQRMDKALNILDGQLDPKMLDTLSLASHIRSNALVPGNSEHFVDNEEIIQAITLCPTNIHAWMVLAQRNQLEDEALNVLWALGYAPMISNVLEEKVMSTEKALKTGLACPMARDTLRQITRLNSDPEADLADEPGDAFEKEYYQRAMERLLAMARKIQNIFDEITPAFETYKLWRKRGSRFEEMNDARQALVDYINHSLRPEKLGDKDSGPVFALDCLLEAGQNQAAKKLSDFLQAKIETGTNLQHYYDQKLDEKVQALHEAKDAYEALPDTSISGGNILLGVCLVLILALVYPLARRPRLNGQSSSLKEFIMIMSLAPRSVGDEWPPAPALKDMCGLSECPDPGYTA